MYQVYALVDPRDMLVRYVGMSKNATVRFANHIVSEKGHPGKHAWIQGLLAEDLLPELHILGQVSTYEEAIELESHWIHHYEDMDMPITNRKGTSGWTYPALLKPMAVGRQSACVSAVMPDLYRPEELSRILRVSVYTIREKLKSGEIQGFRIGGGWRVTAESLESYIAKAEQAQHATN